MVMLKSMRILTITFLSLFLIVNFVQADIFMKQKTQAQGGGMMGMGQGGGEEVQSIWITENKLRSDQCNQSIIMLLDEKKMYMLDHEEKTYAEMPMNMGEMMESKMQEAMAGEDMSAEEKEMMQSMMGGATDIKVTVTPTDETKKIGEWNCRKYIQEMKTMMGPTTSEIWATQDLKIKYDVYQKFKEAFGGQGTFGNMMSSMAEEMKKVEGVPVLTTTTMSMMGANITSTTELIEFKETSAPEGTFKIPGGYKKTDAMKMER